VAGEEGQQRQWSFITFTFAMSDHTGIVASSNSTTTTTVW
jgi:hypothetical protein